MPIFSRQICQAVRRRRGEACAKKRAFSMLRSSCAKIPRRRHVEECPLRFDIVAIDNHPGKPPVVRLHKDAFSAELDRQV